MFAYNSQLTTTPDEPIYSVSYRSGTVRLTETRTEPVSTAPPSGVFNNPVTFVPPHHETDAERSLRKKQRRQHAKASRPRWRQ